MASLSVEGIKVLLFGSTLFREGGILSPSGLKSGVSLNRLDVGGLLGLGNFRISGGSGLVDKLDDLSLNLALGGILLTLNLSDEHVADLFSLDDCDLLVSGRSHADLVLLNFSTRDLRVEILHLSVVVSLHIGQLLILLILKSELLIPILLDMVGEHVLALGLLFEGLSQGLINVDVGHVTVLKDDTEGGELLIQIGYHLSGHISLEIKDLREPDAIDEVPDALIDLRVEKLIESASAKLIHEGLNFLRTSRHAEGEVEVDRDIGVVLGGTVVDRRIVVHNRLGDHASHSLGAAVAPLGARLHNTGRLATALLQGGQTSRDVELKIEAATAVVPLDHDDDRLLISSRLCEELERDKIQVNSKLTLGASLA